MAKVSRLFLTKYPNYPVFRIKIEPGEAYIAPTENIIHDGAKLNYETDFTWTFLGYFQTSSKLENVATR